MPTAPLFLCGRSIILHGVPDLVENLVRAQKMASKLFCALEERFIIRPGRYEKEINTDIYNLARELFGIEKYWHKRIVRAGPNTLYPYRENPPNLEVQKDDIVFLDFGPILEQWEADFGRTYVIGNDVTKLQLKKDVEDAFAIGKNFFKENINITGKQLYDFVSDVARQRGWQYGNEHAGHLIGIFPHEKLQGEEKRNYIHPENRDSMRQLDRQGNTRHWILEIHFVDRVRNFGGFYEELLDIDA